MRREEGERMEKKGGREEKEGRREGGGGVRKKGGECGSQERIHRGFRVARKPSSPPLFNILSNY